MVWTRHWKVPYLHTYQYYVAINADVVHMQPVTVRTTELVASRLASKIVIIADIILI